MIINLVATILAFVFVCYKTSNVYEDDFMKAIRCYQLAVITLILHMINLIYYAIKGTNEFWISFIQGFLWIWIAYMEYQNFIFMAKYVRKVRKKLLEEINNLEGEETDNANR